CDVDALVLYYPPHRTTPHLEVEEFARHLRQTNDPRRPTAVVVLVSHEELGHCSHFMKALGIEEPLLNLSPNHSHFDDIVRFPRATCAEKAGCPNFANLRDSGDK